jgi:hypothetical protein
MNFYYQYVSFLQTDLSDELPTKKSRLVVGRVMANEIREEFILKMLLGIKNPFGDSSPLPLSAQLWKGHTYGIVGEEGDINLVSQPDQQNQPCDRCQSDCFQ